MCIRINLLKKLTKFLIFINFIYFIIKINKQGEVKYQNSN